MRWRAPHPDQLSLGFGKDSEIERIIEARVAIRAEAEAVRWCFRLILIETAMLTMLVLIAGWLIGQPLLMVFRSSLMVCAACLASGLMLVGLSGGLSMLITRVRRRRANRAVMARWVKRS